MFERQAPRETSKEPKEHLRRRQSVALETTLADVRSWPFGYQKQNASFATKPCIAIVSWRFAQWLAALNEAVNNYKSCAGD
jgi:hypothetical protein